MREFTATEAKARLAELLRTVERGEAVAITRHGEPIAHLVPAPADEHAGRIGQCPVSTSPQRMATRGHVDRRHSPRAASRPSPVSLFVLDASVALAWLLDERGKSGADRALTRLEDEEGPGPPSVAPGGAQRFAGGDAARSDRRWRLSARLGALRDLPIRTDSGLDLETAFALAERHALSFYDAVYLELAGRHAAPLATLDNALGRAAAAEGLSPVCDPDEAG